jgi:hypothetical protein
MNTDIEVTTEGIHEPVDITSLKAPRWTQWNEEEVSNYEEDVSDYSTDEDSAFASVRSKRSGKRGKLALGLGLLLAIAAVAGILVAVLVPGKGKRSTNTSAASGTVGGGDGAAEPTAAPTTAEGLPDECVPEFNNVDYCLSQELSVEESEACVECVWRFLPSNDGNCPQLENSVCGILNQCECGTCVIYLEEYLDCQSRCDFDCQLAVSAAARSEEGGNGR